MHVFENQAEYFDFIRQQVDTTSFGYLKTNIDMKKVYHAFRNLKRKSVM